MNVSDRWCNIIPNAYIYNNNGSFWIQWWFKNNFNKFFAMSFFAFIRTLISAMKGYMAMENIN